MIIPSIAFHRAPQHPNSGSTNLSSSPEPDGISGFGRTRMSRYYWIRCQSNVCEELVFPHLPSALPVLYRKISRSHNLLMAHRNRDAFRPRNSHHQTLASLPSFSHHERCSLGRVTESSKLQRRSTLIRSDLTTYSSNINICRTRHDLF